MADIITRITWLIEMAERNIERPYSLKRAAEYLEISSSYLRRLVQTNKINHYRPGNKRIYFRKKDLDDYVFGKNSV